MIDYDDNDCYESGYFSVGGITPTSPEKLEELCHQWADTVAKKATDPFYQEWSFASFARESWYMGTPDSEELRQRRVSLLRERLVAMQHPCMAAN